MAYYNMDRALNQINWHITLARKDTYERYAWCRRKAEYLMRLMFAITVDVILRTRKVDIGKIFSRESAYGQKSVYNCMMGAMIWTAKHLLSKLPPEYIDEETHLLEQVWEILDNIRVLRNDDAHDGTSPEELDQFINDNENWFREVYNITGGRYFKLDDVQDELSNHYLRDLVYIQDEAGPDGKLPCIQIPLDGTQICPFDLAESSLCRWGMGMRQEPDVLKEQLYLRVIWTDIRKCSYYRLSPFILWEAKNDKFLLYQTMLQSLQCEMNLKYISLTMQESEQRYCQLRSLVPQDQKGPYYVYTTRVSHRLEINLRDTNDDGVQRLANRNTRYCTEICPQWKDVLQYCKNRAYRYCVVCGEGGLGKTALVIHIINDCILAGETDYRRVIFLSAKEFYPQYNRPLSGSGSAEKRVSPDFRSYHGFLLQMSGLLLYHEKEPMNCSDEALKERLLQKINVEHIIPEALLLVVDDLDSLKPDDQRDVITFINQITNSKVFVLVTTRTEETSGLRIRLERLDADGCMTFLKWYMDQKNKELSRSLHWDKNLVLQITQGRPYDLQHLANLTCQLGQPFDESQISIFRQFLTPKERTFYLCRTSLQQLNSDEWQLFHFICKMNTALCGSLTEYEEAREETAREKTDSMRPVRSEIPIQLLLYLQLEGMQSKEVLMGALCKLQDVCLLEQKNEGTVQVRSGITYTALLHSDGQPASLPDYLDRILERIRQAPNEWSVDKFVESLLPYLHGWFDKLSIIDLQKSHERQIVQSMWENQDYFTGPQLDKLKRIRQVLKKKLPPDGSPPPAADFRQARFDIF